jgi:hypothetical protein
MQNLPRHIDAPSIQKGDRVRIELPENQGVKHTVEGVVELIENSGGVTYYYTKEGANILAYHKAIKGIRVLLISREDNPGTTMFSENFWKANNEDVFEGLDERIKG